LKGGLRIDRAKAISVTATVGGAVDLALSLLKLLGGVFWHSQALIADGIHSLSDLLSDALVWYAGRHATQAPDLEHPYGHGRFETLTTLALGCLLLIFAAGIGIDAGERLFAPRELLRPEPLALLATAASIVVKEWLYWWTLGYARRVRSDLLRANAWHHRSDAISSIVVLVGITGTLAGLPYLDAIAAVIVAVMIARIAWKLGQEAVLELVDTGLEADRLAAIREIIATVGGVRDIHMLRTRRHGGQVSMDVHVLVDPRISVSEGHMIALVVESRLKGEIDAIADVTIHVDPEDDEAAPLGIDLPTRVEAMARLQKVWSHISEALLRQRTTLHYLNGRIDVEVYLPLKICRAKGIRVQTVREDLQSALAGDPVFNQVSVYFG
jgi:cation diffusion facilitator family transporter